MKPPKSTARSYVSACDGGAMAIGTRRDAVLRRRRRRGDRNRFRRGRRDDDRRGHRGADIRRRRGRRGRQGRRVRRRRTGGRSSLPTAADRRGKRNRGDHSEQNRNPDLPGSRPAADVSPDRAQPTSFRYVPAATLFPAQPLVAGEQLHSATPDAAACDGDAHSGSGCARTPVPTRRPASTRTNSIASMSTRSPPTP